jgi:hypothetical protein
MKTLGRILIILAVFSIFSGLMVVAVNASGANASAFDGASSQLRPGGGINQLQPEGGQNRPEHGGRGGGWVFGVVKNVGVMAALITLIVLPRSVAKKKRKQAAVNAVNDQP